MLETIERNRSKGPYILSTSDGKTPYAGFSKAKRLLDAKIAELRAKEGRASARLGVA